MISSTLALQLFISLTHAIWSRAFNSSEAPAASAICGIILSSQSISRVVNVQQVLMRLVIPEPAPHRIITRERQKNPCAEQKSWKSEKSSFRMQIAVR